MPGTSGQFCLLSHPLLQEILLLGLIVPVFQLVGLSLKLQPPQGTEQGTALPVLSFLLSQG